MIKTTLDFIVYAFEVAWPEAILLTATRGEQGLNLVNEQKPDLVLLDLGLQDISGFEVAKQIRQISDVPIIIITARDEEFAIVKALGVGADEYLVKPFGQMELIAR
jgi:two-component system KDP operon response regulator KdpE